MGRLLNELCLTTLRMLFLWLTVVSLLLVFT